MLRKIDVNIDLCRSVYLTQESEDYAQMSIDFIGIAKAKYGMSFDNTYYILLAQYLEQIEKRTQKTMRKLHPDYIRMLKENFVEEHDLSMYIVNKLNQYEKVAYGDEHVVSLTLLFLEFQFQLSQKEAFIFCDIYRDMYSIISKHTLGNIVEDEGLHAHLKFLSYRILKDKVDYQLNDMDLFELVYEKYPVSCSVAREVAAHICETYACVLSNDELMYLSIYIRHLMD